MPLGSASSRRSLASARFSICRVRSRLTPRKLPVSASGSVPAFSAWYCRAAFRYWLEPANRDRDLGFRVAATVPKKP